MISTSMHYLDVIDWVFTGFYLIVRDEGQCFPNPPLWCDLERRPWTGRVGWKKQYDCIESSFRPETATSERAWPPGAAALGAVSKRFPTPAPRLGERPKEPSQPTWMYATTTTTTTTTTTNTDRYNNATITHSARDHEAFFFAFIYLPRTSLNGSMVRTTSFEWPIRWMNLLKSGNHSVHVRRRWWIGLEGCQPFPARFQGWFVDSSLSSRLTSFRWWLERPRLRNFARDALDSKWRQLQHFQYQRLSTNCLLWLKKIWNFIWFSHGNSNQTSAIDRDLIKTQ